MDDLFEDEIKIRGYEFTNDVTGVIPEGQTEVKYYVASKSAKWYKVEDYKWLPTKFHNFFEKAVIPAKNMHLKYHTQMYPGLKEYRELVSNHQIKRFGNLHMGLGHHINLTTKFNNSVIRTTNNSNYQFWSILSLIALEKFRRVVKQSKYVDDIQFISSIYDSIYILVRND